VGDFAITGTYIYDGLAGPSSTPVSNGQFLIGQSSGWSTDWFSAIPRPGSNWIFTVSAVCFDNPPLRP